jgi:hypothetical protein
MSHWIPYFLLVFIGSNFLATGLNAQSSKDLVFIERMNEELSLSSIQKTSIIEVYHKTMLELDSVQQVIKVIEKSAMPEEQVRLQVLVLNQEKKDIKEFRDLEVEQLLESEQLAKYKSDIKPDKPAVLHFGIHNRDDCRVCTK